MPTRSTRSWGTRFDTLPSSPPVSPPAHETTTSLISSSSSTKLENVHDQNVPLLKKEEKMPHDASVFVGSLPCSIEQQELARLLSQHLSEHTEVKSIKVVRDSRGGVCAFVQCENAASAATLIHTLQTSPRKLFLGRVLRYEPARAFRTLLISYRTPIQYVSVSSGNMLATESETRKTGQAIELSLPYAMRVSRGRNSRFISILYNVDAIEAEDRARNTSSNTPEYASLFLHPVVFNDQAIHKLASYFGRLEHFGTCYLHDNKGGNVKDGDQDWSCYPPPHDSIRSPGMDSSCWEIKWEHRDDCVNALMTLRRVPHLTVTWAHQPLPFGSLQNGHSPHQTSISRLNSLASLQSLSASYSRADIAQNGEDSALVASDTGTSVVTEGDGIKRRTRPSEDIHDGLPEQCASRCEGPHTTADWSEMDFPPLSNSGALPKPEQLVWAEKKASEEHIKRPLGSISQLTLAGQPDMPCSASFGSVAQNDQSRCQIQELEMPSTPALGLSPFTPKLLGFQAEFPVLPTDVDSGSQQLSSKKDTSDKENRHYDDQNTGERELDRTTLFVGGLETTGPGAWDEEKVGKYFARFGGLEGVKVVKPANSHAAFAFVKFNNTESPARAVFEEHNRVYEGRTMRVQLRECNPHRGPWRHNRGRGRGPPSNFNYHRRLPDRPSERPPRDSYDHSDNQTPSPQTEAHVTSASDDETVIKDSDMPLSGDKNLGSPEEEQDHEQHHQSTDSHSSSPEPSIPASNVLSNSENYREWYDEPSSATLTPPPSSLGSSISASASTHAASYPLSGGYYAPPPWLYPYAPQFPYQFPYFGLPGYPLQSHHSLAVPPGPDTSATPGHAQNYWPLNAHGSYIPYSPTVPPSQSATGASLEQSQQLNTRAPLLPTGFIQKEQGPLIAVYQPEALDQYMAGVRSGPPVVGPAPGPGWFPYAASHGTTFPVPPMMSLPSRHSVTDMGWAVNQGFIMPPQAVSHVPQHSVQGSAVALRGGFNPAGQQSGPPHRRAMGRRDQGHMYNQNRSNQTRSFVSRSARGNGSFSAVTQGEANARVSQNWTQWNVGR